jgi:preprotein translocase subunit SecG
MLYEVLLVCYLIVAIFLIGFVLIQQGKGADMGASFGSGGSNTVFGSGGSGNFMTRTTAILATCFFVISLMIGGITAGTSETTDEFDNIEVPDIEQAIPVLEDSLIPVADTVNEEAALNTVPAAVPADPEPDSSN